MHIHIFNTYTLHTYMTHTHCTHIWHIRIAHKWHIHIALIYDTYSHTCIENTYTYISCYYTYMALTWLHRWLYDITTHIYDIHKSHTYITYTCTHTWTNIFVYICIAIILKHDIYEIIYENWCLVLILTHQRLVGYSQRLWVAWFSNRN